MWKFQRKKCTEQIVGKIVSSRSMGPGQPTVIYVRYKVGDKVYEIYETVKLTTEKAMLRGVPIGQKPVPMLGSVEIGKKVRVNYMPSNPEKAYLTDNVGIVDVIASR